MTSSSTFKPTTTESPTQAPKLFISYSHDSDAHCEKVLSLTNQLRRDGFDAIIDQQVNDPAEGWTRWMDNGLDEADFVLVVCTKTYKLRVMGKEKKGIGCGAKFEGRLIYNAINRNDSNSSKFIPVLFSEVDKQYVLNILDGNIYVLDSVDGYNELCSRLEHKHKAFVAKLGRNTRIDKRSIESDSKSFLEQLKANKKHINDTEEINSTILGKHREETESKNTVGFKLSKDRFGLESNKLILFSIKELKRNQERRQRQRIECFVKLNTKKQSMLFADRVSGSNYFAPVMVSNIFAAPSYLIERQKELQMLNDDWFNPNTNIRCLIAWGGVGKTSLISTWLSQLHEENYRNARVLGYSFYSQGSSDERQVSVESFVQVLINWLQLSEQQRAAMPTSAHEKGVYLANQILKQKSLLILDGLEPMQFPPGNDAKHTGTLKDATLKALLKQLATAAPGDSSPLLVITSRLSVTDLQNFFNTSVQEHNLENLSIDAGIQLLKHLGVKGRQKELEAAVTEVSGHALAVTLLGTFVAEVCDGDIQQRDTLPSLTEEESQGHHAKRVIAQYLQWLQHSGKPDINILYLMSLFDRPTEHHAIAALLSNEVEVIEGVTDRLTGLSKHQWKQALNRLQKLGLLNKPYKPSETDQSRNSAHYWQGLDCHPLIREYFAGQLQQLNPKGYQAAHQHLYEYFKTVPEKQQPDTLQEMEPLFMAVAHGCKAGLHQQAIDEVYYPRIKREGEHYLTKKLGAFGADLACVAHFFQQTWDVPAQEVDDAARPFVLNLAAFNLRGLGRLQEAVQPFEAGFRLSKLSDDYRGAAQDASNLSELLLSSGQVEKAVQAGEQAVHYADLSEDEKQQIFALTTLADALYHRAITASIEIISESASGSKTEIKTESENANHAKIKTLPIPSNADWKRALELFKDAEQRQKQLQPAFQYLYSLQGFQYCQLLLSMGRVEEVVKRVEALITYRQSGDSILSVSLENLCKGQALSSRFKKLFSVSGSEPVENISEQAQILFSNSQNWLDQAVEGLRNAVQQDYLIRGLFTRTEFFTLTQHHIPAWHDLDEAYDIASYGGMQLFLTDYYLAAAEDIQTQLGWRKGAQGLAQELGLELDFGLDDRACDDRDLNDRDGTEAESTTGFVIKEQGRLLHPTQAEMEKRLEEYLQKAGKLMQECNYFLHKQRLQTLKDTAAGHGL